MERTTPAYELLIEKFVAWAQARPDIRAAAIIGSRARADQPADEWSDLDLWIITEDPHLYLAGAGWLENIGNCWITFLEPVALGEGMERRAIFEGGLDVDFAFDPRAAIERMIEQGPPSDIAALLQRGTRVLFDKDGLVGRLIAFSSRPEPERLPLESELLNVINDFWYHAVWTAKKLRRGELWTAKSCCDGYMKRLLLRMIEWHTHARTDQSSDTWHNGRFLEQWSDPRVLEGLAGAFAYYDEEDIRRALFATMDLFRWVARETAERLNTPYPALADEKATQLVSSLLLGV